MQCFLSCLGGDDLALLLGAARCRPWSRSQEVTQPSLETLVPVRRSHCCPALPACLSLGFSRAVGGAPGGDPGCLSEGPGQVNSGSHLDCHVSPKEPSPVSLQLDKAVLQIK